MPKISIIMPTFNVEKYIARAIKSCINQTFKDI
ncbi:glycosyltransferase, partial [Campylobacter canadensis]